MTTSLALIAEDPDFFLDPPEGAERIADDRYCITIGSENRWAGVCRLRLPEEPRAVAETVAEILASVEGVRTAVWNIGQSASPVGLAERLRILGLQDPEPPLDPVAAAMVLTAEPPPSPDGVAVRRIANLDDHLAGLEIMLASDDWSPEAGAKERATASETFEKRMRQGGMQWLALLEGEPVAFAAAGRAEFGLYLSGGATLPEARGNGCYRALVRARWDEAMRLGLTGLAVQAQYGSSAPILRRLGFHETGVIHTLQSWPRGSS